MKNNTTPQPTVRTTIPTPKKPAFQSTIVYKLHKQNNTDRSSQKVTPKYIDPTVTGPTNVQNEVLAKVR